MERRLSAILAADVVGYSRLMERDEADTFQRLRVHRQELFEPEIEKHHGRIFKLMGDGLLAEFGSVVDAVACAVALQGSMAERNAGIAADRRIDFRIGVNLGDVIIEGEDRHGEGVNIAARLEQLAEPGGICMSQQAYDQVETKLNLGYKDLGQHRLKNIAKPVRVYRVDLAGAGMRRRRPTKWRSKRGVMVGGLMALAIIGGTAAWYRAREPADPVLALPKGPSIAVLPLANLSDDPNDTYFSDGLTEDIITALARVSHLFVIARHSTSQFKGEAVDPRDIARRLGARYVLKGSVRRSQGQLRVTVQLLDAKDGKHLWSETYDRNLTAAEVFAVQDEITRQLVGLIGSSDAPLWRSQRQTEMRERRPDTLEAYECVLLTYVFYETFAAKEHARARDCLERTVEIDPGYSLARSRLAFMYIEEHKYGYNARPQPLERALTAAQKAIELDPQNQDAYYALAIIRYISDKDFEAFRATAEQALALNPNDAWIVGDLGTWTAYSGEWERGKALVRKSMILNPLHQRWLHFPFFLDHYRKGEYREARAVALKINLPQNHMAQAGLAAVYGQLGETESAKATIEHILAIHPKFAEDPRAAFVTRRMPRDLVEAIMDGLRKGGLQVPPAPA
jgi:TolB-like protein/class 3 adenylate cyclase/Tfp pilus assembly protein PilF